MDLSIFLAKLIGIYLLIIAFELALRKKEIEKSIKDFSASKGLLIFSGSISLLLGLAIVISHPIYDPDWEGLITLLGYILVASGVIRFAFPSYLQKKIEKTLHQRYWLLCFILALLGTYLTYSGFTALPLCQ